MAQAGPDIGRVRIRVPSTIKKGEVVTIRALVTHPMEVMAFGKDKKPVKKNYHFVNKIVATFNGKEIFQAETTQAVSQNPSIAFPLKVAEAGKLTITFMDTHGQSYEGTVDIKF
jgi:sulfur-oxidizing protein SoxZ